MVYSVSEIDRLEDIENANPFEVNNFLWTCVYKPKAYGYMAYCRDIGFVLRFIVKEENPQRTFTQPQDPVYQDSAVEAFVSFQTTQPNQESLYMNFEINAHGAMLANFGYGRHNRQMITEEMYQQCQVKATVNDKEWTVDFIIPIALIKTLTGIDDFNSGDILYCNFYKIAERKEIEHYASFSPIISEKPNFHLPEFFAKAVIE